MDRKTIIVVVACFVLLLIWGKLVNRIYPPRPIPASATNAVTSVTAVSTTATNQTTTATSAPPAAVATTTTIAAPKSLPDFQGDEQTIVLSNPNARYTFTSHGGGLKTIELLKFPETVSRSKHAPTNAVATLNSPQAAAVLSVLADESVHGDGLFTLSESNSVVHAEKLLTNGLRIVKEFRPDSNYLVHATVRMQNTSTTPITLPSQEWVIGTATPMGPDDHGDVEGVMWYDGNRTEERLRPWFDNKGFNLFGIIRFSSDAPRSEFRAGQSNVVWVAAENQFFTLTAMPKTQAVQVVSRVIELPRPKEGWASATNNPVPKGFQTALIYPDVTISPGQTFERQFSFYGGPKEYRTLSRIAEGFQNNADLVMGYGGFMGFFAKILLLSMNGLHDLLRLPYGWATIVLTVIIKVLFWPLTAASTRSAKRMQALAPQMKALQEKYKDDPKKFSQKQWEFWKKNKVNPLSGCLPMLVQLPVFFGLYSMLRSAIELRGAHWLWVADLSKPDTLFVIPGLTFFPFSLLGTSEGLPINLLPLIYISTALWQSHLMPTSPGMDPAQQRMIRWMPLLFLAILYNFSSGLALYMTVNNLLTILQTKLTKTTEPTAVPVAPVLTPPQKKKK
jgi:YidC/Oxa1 family membrane protein insertase